MNFMHLRNRIYREVSFICLTEFNKKKLLLLNRKEMNIDPDKIYIKPNFTQKPDIKAAEDNNIFLL